MKNDRLEQLAKQIAGSGITPNPQHDPFAVTAAPTTRDRIAELIRMGVHANTGIFLDYAAAERIADSVISLGAVTGARDAATKHERYPQQVWAGNFPADAIYCQQHLQYEYWGRVGGEASV